MAKITVTAKDDLGFSPKFGQIVKGQTHEIEEEDFAEQLFEGPTPDYKPVWVRRAEEEAAQPAQSTEFDELNELNEPVESTSSTESTESTDSPIYEYPETGGL